MERVEISERPRTIQSSMNRAFPERFEFFHYGQVERAAPHPSPYQASPFVVIFKVTGDEVGHCVVAFDTAPENAEQESMVIELANVMASKFVTQLSGLNGLLIGLSPPSVLKNGEKRHRSLLRLVQDAVTYHYEFTEGSGRRGLRMTYLPSRAGNG